MASFSSHSWEGWATREEVTTDGLPGAWDGEEVEDTFDFDAIDVTAAGEMLAELLVSLKLAGNINATYCCTIAWFVRKLGCTDEVIKNLAVRPDSQTGQFSKKK